MAGAFGGKAAFNPASPSSHKDCVQRIVDEFVTPLGRRPARILDVGGTNTGFLKQLPANPPMEVVIANPEANVGASYAYVQDIPLPGPNFDLALMFGVLMYLKDPEMLELMRAVRQRMRGSTFLLADPDPFSASGATDITLKLLASSVFLTVTLGQFNPIPWRACSANRAGEMLLRAGFSQCRLRPELSPWAMGHYRLPPYYVIQATI